MKLYLERGIFTKESTGGILVLNETLFAMTLEDQVRFGEKVMHETAIPYGVYKIILSLSPKFGYVTPELLNVPQFTGIRIHPLNNERQTDGCIGVAKYLGIDTKRNDLVITESKITFDLLMAELRKVDSSKEEITIEITKR